MNRAAFFMPTVECGFVHEAVFCPFSGCFANPRPARVCPFVHERFFFVSSCSPRPARVCPRNDEKHPYTPGGGKYKIPRFFLFYIYPIPPLFFSKFACFVDKPNTSKGYRRTRFFCSWTNPRRITSGEKHRFFFRGQNPAGQRLQRFQKIRFLSDNVHYVKLLKIAANPRPARVTAYLHPFCPLDVPRRNPFCLGLKRKKTVCLTFSDIPPPFARTPANPCSPPTAVEKKTPEILECTFFLPRVYTGTRPPEICPVPRRDPAAARAPFL